MVSQVNVNRWFENARTLAGWNRYSYGSQIATARDFIVAKLQALGGFNITIENYNLGGTPRWNIIAILRGSTTPNDHYIAGAHLDSTSQASGNERVSPGAEDDGSGSAGLLEMATVFAANPPKQTMYFKWFTGEEQGLVGSAASASNVVSRGDTTKVKQMVHMDMIGYKSPSNPHRVLLETSRQYSEVVAKFQAVATQYCDQLQTTVSYNPFGSDHVSYLRRNMPALLTIDNDYGSYPHYHRTTDLPQYLVHKMAFEIVKMNVALLGEIMGYTDTN